MTATLSQDMYLAGSIVLILSVLTVIGTLISDILLAWLDPRIRYGERGT
jgi:peptide/nickel transport system permease protein